MLEKAVDWRFGPSGITVTSPTEAESQIAASEATKRSGIPYRACTNPMTDDRRFKPRTLRTSN